MASLASSHRCVVAVLPLGGHRRPMPADADLSLHALADLLAEFIEVLDLDQVTLVGVAQALRLSFMWRVPMTFGWMAKRPIPKDVRTSWITGLRTERGVRRDVAKYVRTSDLTGLEQAAIELAAFERPTLIVWATRDKVMPPEHGRRLADIIPDSTLVELDDGDTLLALDCPDEVATHIAAFVARLPDGGRNGR